MTLVQVGEGAWIDPTRVTAIKHWPPRQDHYLYKDNDGWSPDNTVIMQEDKATISYWPHERILRALNVSDVTWIHEVWESLQP